MIHCKRDVTLRSTAEWEKKTQTHTHTRARTHTDIQRGSNKPYLKKGKRDKRRIRTASIQ